MVSNVHLIQHPLVDHHLTKLRDLATNSAAFRQTLRPLTGLLAIEATRDLRLADRTVTTPLQETAGKEVCDRVGLIPILRAGLGMVETVLEFLPESEVWHLGLYRDEETAEPVEYYRKFPPSHPVDVALVLDPMLATGGSAAAACTTLERWGVRSVKLLAVIASRSGIEVLQRGFPSVSVYVCAIDGELNQNNFIVPGLGDAGDRLFNTVPKGKSHNHER